MSCSRAIAVDVGADDGLSTGHRFEQHDSERLLPGRRCDEDVAGSIPFDQLVEGQASVVCHALDGDRWRPMVLADDITGCVDASLAGLAEGLQEKFDALPFVAESADEE